MTATAPQPSPRASPQSTSAPASGSTARPSRPGTGLTGSLATGKSLLPAREPGRLSTPGLLRLLMALCTIATVLFGVVAASTTVLGRNDLVEASRSSEQLTRAQTIQIQLTQADAAMTESFVAAPAEAPSRITVYQDSIWAARGLLVESAEAQPGDSDQLQELNRDLNRYQASMERAWALVPYDPQLAQNELRRGSEYLRGETLGLLREIEETNRTRLDRQSAPISIGPSAVTGLLALGTLAVASGVIAVRFRRVVNLGLVGGMVLVVGGLTVTGLSLTYSNATAAMAINGNLAQTQTAADLRVDAYQAKTLENLSLVDLSLHEAYQAPWQDLSNRVDTGLQELSRGNRNDNVPAQLWATHQTAFEATQNLLRQGQLAPARTLAYQTSDPAGSDITFRDFDRALAPLIEQYSETGLMALRAPQDLLVTASVFTALTGLGAAGASIRGIRSRLREFQ